MPNSDPVVLAVLDRGVVGVVDPCTAVVGAFDDALTRGDGCFEGIRVRTGPDGTTRPDKLERHLARMARSARALELSFDAAAMTELVERACAAWIAPDPPADPALAGEGALKLVLGRAAGESSLAFATITAPPADYARQRRDGIAVVTLARGLPSDAFADAPWLLGGVKTLSYAINMAAAREAARRGADDVVFVSSDGHVLEAPRASVVWTRGRSMRTTPTGATGILAGTTQELLFDQAAAAGWDVDTELITVARLRECDTVWVIGSGRGPVEVVSIDGSPQRRDARLAVEIRSLCGFPPAA